MSVLRRYPPFIVGDGQRTIGALIDIENALRQKMQPANIRLNNQWETILLIKFKR
jgi:cyanophycin synthetase